MSVPPPMLAVPPPSMQSVEQINVGTVTTPIVQSTNIVSQAPAMVTATPVQTIAAPQNQPQIIQQTILTPGGNMAVIQQPVTNLNVPPPTNLLPIKPPPVQLTQPPPNIQLHQQQAPTQIVLNQPQTNYQYITQQTPVANPADAVQPQNSVTIQHIYQPQGIVQQTPISAFTTQQTPVRPPSQQYILQGNTA